MKSVRNHLSLILPLFAMLFAVEYLLVFERVVKIYESRLVEQYSVLVVADKTLRADEIAHADTLVDRVEFIDANHALRRIRKQVSEESFQKIQAVMPAFYSLKLRHYPDRRDLEKLKEELLSLKGVKRVRVFEKVHTPLYTMLAFMKNNLLFFALLLGMTSLLLMMKQMYIWQLEHKERMQVMALFGAPVWLRSGVLFRLAVVDAFLALLLAAAASFYLINNEMVLAFLSEIDIHAENLVKIDDFGPLAGISLGLALLCAFWVIVRFKEES